MGTGKSWAHMRIWQREGWGRRKWNNWYWMQTYNQPSTGQNQTESRFREKESNGNRDLWCEIILCLWDFPMDGTTGMECYISHPLVKPIWRLKAGSVGRRVWFFCISVVSMFSGASESWWRIISCRCFIFTQSAKWHWAIAGARQWTRYATDTVEKTLALPSMNFYSNCEKQLSVANRTQVWPSVLRVTQIPFLLRMFLESVNILK